MINLGFMKKKFLFILKILSFAFLYSAIFIVSVFFTMSILIKGKEIKAPNFVGKTLNDSYKIASQKNVRLKKIMGNYNKNYEPLTVIDQFPCYGVTIKEKSFVKVFVNSETSEVIVPDLTGYTLKNCKNMLKDNDLRKGYLSYIDADYIPVDFIIAQSYTAGTRILGGSKVDLLVSKGRKSRSYIMPDLIGKQAEKVVFFFESKGLKISKITQVPYHGLESGIIIKQFPSSGFRINSKNLISIQVSE